MKTPKLDRILEMRDEDQYNDTLINAAMAELAALRQESIRNISEIKLLRERLETQCKKTDAAQEREKRLAEALEKAQAHLCVIIDGFNTPIEIKKTCQDIIAELDAVDLREQPEPSQTFKTK